MPLGHGAVDGLADFRAAQLSCRLDDAIGPERAAGLH
jgi:hypothetical protein